MSRKVDPYDNPISSPPSSQPWKENPPTAGTIGPDGETRRDIPERIEPYHNPTRVHST